MKKAFVAILSLAALVGCSRDVVVDAPASAIIQFGDSFVENKTRAAADPSTTKDNILEFSAWGFRGEDTNPLQLVFDGQYVSRPNKDTDWSYSPLQYWLQGQSYFFAAVSPAVYGANGEPNANITVTENLSKQGLGTIDFINDGATDLLYAEANVLASELASELQNGSDMKVKLQFAHLLSKIKFTFSHTFNHELTTVAVKNVCITNSPKSGSIDVTADRLKWAWDLGEKGATIETVELEFGDVNGGKAFAGGKDNACESDNVRLVIPSDIEDELGVKIDFKFDVIIYHNGVEADTFKDVTSSLNVKEQMKDKAFVPGKSYNLVGQINPDTTLGLEPIEFTVVEVKDWVLDGNEFPEEPDQPVQLATPDVKADVNGKDVTLTWADVAGAANYTVQVDTNAEEVVNGTSFVFPGDYNTTYKFTVKAIAADTTKNTNSDAAVVTATTEADPTVGPTYTTVDDFLKAAEDESETAPMYTLKGTITAVDNTEYGNFDLTDDTGTVYIYGLNSPDGATKKYWETSGAKLGDDIVVKTVRTSFNGTPQGKYAWFVELVSPGTRAFWSFDLDNVVFASTDAAKQTVNVVAYNIKDAITVSSNNDHFTATYADGVVTIAAAENTTYEKIEGIITVTCGSLSKQITVSQAAMQDPTVGVVKGSPYSYTFASTIFKANDTKALDNLNWTVSGDGEYWGFDNNKGQQFGSSKKPYKALTISTEDYTDGVETIKLTTSGASDVKATLEVYVGGEKLGETVNLTATSTEYIFSNNGELLTGKVEFKYTQTSSKAIYIKTITIN